MATDSSELRTLSPLHQAAVHFPTHSALIWHQDGIRLALTYKDLSQKVIALGEQLNAQGLSDGDRLACIDSNSIELIILYWACIDTGILFCPLSPRFPIKQIAKLIKQHRLNYIWAGDEYSPPFSRHKSSQQPSPVKLFSEQSLSTATLKLDFTTSSLNSPIKIDQHKLANIILTSGSSGTPKAAVHSLANHLASALGSSALIPLHAGDGWFLSLPLFHIGGLAIINRCALAGATVVMQDKEINLPTQLSQYPITHLSLVSTQLVRLLEAEFDVNTTPCLKGIRSLLLGGGAISVDLIDKLKTLSISSFTSYGMTEMSSQITTGPASDDGNSGQTIFGREVKIRDELIYVKGETLFLGYLNWQGNQPLLDLPLDDEGWFATKDRGYWDKQGSLHILGRSDNMFICGGENVQPEEIEAALKQHPDIEDAIVFPQIDSEFGNLPAAIIKFADPDQGFISRGPESKTLTQFLHLHIARFKRPRVYYPWPEIESVSLKVPRKQIIEAVLKRNQILG
ncbi:o-succinylbenzoate--CoA ligase [Shewanella sp. D64]|uniref:o-succinylbenzoate--CoA ligase n=1 Tax=unclassified Shewanella TaxID=196818 RepID=UPI0022BA655B|nr:MULTISPECIES: o-succinylbenzoate--CoA ligase [unclassified Shewanella]MEC4728745.1 o-succinylbenzoate--CoA ligase [Shewanella sp. D64]MEC4740614.1 o-succinylbenzoate--CoA ligase [Shewanella sp. E94]WBJ95129.1 o-succinylbenzoate--CoA ligase [Shewanella sp. MTB7]